jgi:carbon-monoxide dehydrogenase large subunit
MTDAAAVAGRLAVRPRALGARAMRGEDDRRLTGQGNYLADLKLPGMLEVAFVRSHLAHARVMGVDRAAAEQLAGVVAVVDGSDLEGLSPVPDYADFARGVRMEALCRDVVRFVGAPIAAVVAVDRYVAEDAAELVRPELEELPAVMTFGDAAAEGAQRLYPDWPDNTVLEFPASDPEVDAAFARHRVVSGSYAMGRSGSAPMEGRGVAAELRAGRLTVWTSTQLPHIARSLLCEVLGLPERDIRVIAPDVGGGFGGKAEVYREELLVAWLALALGRPVRWVEDRHENLTTMAHSRDMRINLEAAVADDGCIQALRGAVEQDCGSGEMFPYGFATGLVAQGSLPGAYKIPLQAVSLKCVVTNKTPSGAYRGFGVPEAVFAMERLVDRIAAELELDPIDLRRRMLLTPEDLPYVTATGAHLQSGSHRAAFDRSVSLGRQALERARERFAGDADARIGLGVATYVEGTAASYFGATGNWTHQESAKISFDTEGCVTASLGLAAFGQGTHHMVSAILAEQLGVRASDVRVIVGDTDVSPYGLGSWSSRGTVVAAASLERAATPLREKGKRIAAHMLEASEEDLEPGDGRFTVRGSAEHYVEWKDVARAALARTLDLPPGESPGLDSVETVEAPGVEHEADARGRINANATYTNSTQVAVVKVDALTGVVEVLDYVVVHDCGRVINPPIVKGQLQGGVAQGIGGALYEEFRFDERGQPKSSTFMDYLLPTAMEVPSAIIEEIESPAPETVLGVKGCGESGIVGPGATIAAAVQDALGPGAAEITSLPITPVAVLHRLRAAGAGS